MSPSDMRHISSAANVLGTIGTILWCVQLLPQIAKNYRRHGTDGLSPIMMFSWAIAAVPFGIYTIAQYLNIPLQIQPQLFLLLCLICWAQCMYYDTHWSLRKCLLVVTALCILFGGIEVGVIVGIRVPINNGEDWPTKIFGALGLTMIAAGLVPPYIDIYRERRVRGFSFIFLMIDMGGALFSLLSLFFEEFDPLAAVIYLVVLVMESGIFLCHWYFLFKAYEKGRREKRIGNLIKEQDRQKSPKGQETESPQRDITLNPVFSSISQEAV